MEPNETVDKLSIFHVESNHIYSLLTADNHLALIRELLKNDDNLVTLHSQYQLYESLIKAQ